MGEELRSLQNDLMRQWGLRWVLGVAGMFVFSAAPALAANTHGPKVDDRVAFAADSSASTTTIPVIVFGKGINGRKNPVLSSTRSLGLATAGSVTAGQLDELARDTNVAYIAADVAMAPLGTDTTSTTTSPVPAFFPVLEALFPAVDNAPTAWARGYTGAGIGIAVIDSGLQQEQNFGTPSRVKVTAGANSGTDEYGHGSLVAHVAAGASPDGRFEGIAPGASVVTYNVNTAHGTRTSDVIEGLIWVLVNRDKYNIRVVNLSLAETTPSSYQESVLDTAVEVLWRYGIVVVAAAGNNGPDTATFAPANDPFVITVGSTDANGTVDGADDAVSPWSTRGTTVDGFSKPELYAPGRLVIGHLPGGSALGKEAPLSSWAVWHDYAYISGTSFAAPQVAGAAAVLLQQHPEWTPDQVKWVLTQTARLLSDHSGPSLDLAAATAYADTPPAANAGIPYSTFGMPDWTSALLQSPGSWQGKSWQKDTWNGNSWTGNSWTQNGWKGNSWTGNSWTGNSWTGNSWTGNSWNDKGWD
jgi:serine protease AprX